MSDPPASKPHRHPSLTPDDAALFSYQAFLARMMGEELLAKRVLRLFVQDVPFHVEALLRHIEHQDLNLAAQAVHTIKGAVGNLAVDRLYQLCLEIERTARQGEPQRLPELGQQLAVLFSRLVREIEHVL